MTSRFHFVMTKQKQQLTKQNEFNNWKLSREYISHLKTSPITEFQFFEVTIISIYPTNKHMEQSNVVENLEFTQTGWNGQQIEIQKLSHQRISRTQIPCRSEL